MNNLVSNFTQIVSFAREYNLPLNKKRAILREFLQSKILSLIYQKRISQSLFFIGGTSLRLLYNLDRFSEDLDFDYESKISLPEIRQLVRQLQQQFGQENIECQLYQNQQQNRDYYELRFPNLLFELEISKNKQEKLMIKLDFDNYFQHLSPTVKLFNRYGFLTKVVTVSLNTILTQKMAAYLLRKQTQPRDLYDLVWLLSHQAKIDTVFLKQNKLSLDLAKQCFNKFRKEEAQIPKYQQRLKPFLFTEKNSQQIEFLGELLKKSLN